MARQNIMLHPGFIYTRRSNRQPRASTQSTRVLLAHGYTLYREGLRRLLESQSDMHVVGLASDWPGVTERCRLVVPHVLVMDIALLPSGPSGVAELLNHQPGLRILLLAFPLSEVEVKEAARLGVHGILGNCDSAELVLSVRALHRGENSFSAEVVSMMAGEPETSSIEERAPVSLTPGEETVLSLIAQGMRDKPIAEALSVSPKTVRNRLFLLYRKLRVRNRTEAALYAVKEGLVSLDQGLSPQSTTDGIQVATGAARRPEAPIGL